MSDGLIFMCYEYGSAIGRSASEVLELPIDEILGYFAYKRAKKNLTDG